jgi:hypothetical protein
MKTMGLISLVFFSMFLLSCVTTTRPIEIYQQEYQPSQEVLAGSIIQKIDIAEPKIPKNSLVEWKMQRSKLEGMYQYRTIFINYYGDNSKNIEKNNDTNSNLDLSTIVFASLTTAAGSAATIWAENTTISNISKGATIFSGITGVVIGAINGSISKELKKQKEVDNSNKVTVSNINQCILLVEKNLDDIARINDKEIEDKVPKIIDDMKINVNALEKVYLDLGLIKRR